MDELIVADVDAHMSDVVAAGVEAVHVAGLEGVDVHGHTVERLVAGDAVELIAELLPKVLCQKIFTVLQDSNASEHAARMLAMQAATDNANELIQDLTLQYNKTRQQTITNELLDIIGGSLR